MEYEIANTPETLSGNFDPQDTVCSSPRGRGRKFTEPSRLSGGDRSPSVLRLHELRTSIAGRPLHRGISLSVDRGEIVGIVGNSGSGKSLLLKCIMGLLPPDDGVVKMFDTNLYSARDAELRGIASRCGVLFQHNALFSTLTVRENVIVPLRHLSGLPDDLLHEIADMKIAAAGLPADVADRLPGELSGGMAKRAGLARAIATDPELLLLDEPTTGLDVIMAEQIDSLIHDMARVQNIAVILVTHDVDTLFEICDRAAALFDGEIVTLCEPRFLHKSRHPWVKAFLNARPRTLRAS